MTGAAIALAVVCFAALFGFWCADEEKLGRKVNEKVAGWVAVIVTIAAASFGYTIEALVRWIFQ